MQGDAVHAILSEPLAAALAVVNDNTDRRLAVCHLGGGTFDVTLLDVDQGVLKVEAVGGDTHWVEMILTRSWSRPCWNSFHRPCGKPCAWIQSFASGSAWRPNRPSGIFRKAPRSP